MTEFWPLRIDHVYLFCILFENYVSFNGSSFPLVFFASSLNLCMILYIDVFQILAFKLPSQKCFLHLGFLYSLIWNSDREMNVGWRNWKKFAKENENLERTHETFTPWDNKKTGLCMYWWVKIHFERVVI